MSLEMKNVSHIYQKGSAKESYALRDICLNVNEGEFLGIVGHTGSGKSTLIQHLNGLLKPSRGEVFAVADFCLFVCFEDAGEIASRVFRDLTTWVLLA